MFGYRDGSRAVLTMSIRRKTPCDALITGSEGTVNIPDPWWHSEHFVLSGRDGKQKKYFRPYIGNGYSHQAEAFMEMIRAGRKESVVMPLEDSISIMESLDRVREISGVRYPMEGMS